MQSAVGKKGIIKKVCTWLLVEVGAIIDRLLLISSETVGIKLPFTYLVAIVVTIWLICNELLSIIENMNDMGIPMPSFLRSIVKYVEVEINKKGDEMISSLGTTAQIEKDGDTDVSVDISQNVSDGEEEMQVVREEEESMDISQNVSDNLEVLEEVRIENEK